MVFLAAPHLPVQVELFGRCSFSSMPPTTLVCLVLLFAWPSSAAAFPVTSGGVLIAYYTASNHTRTLAASIHEGVLGVLKAEQVRFVSIEQATFKDDVMWADGVILGCPVYNSNIAGPMMEWLDSWNYQEHGLTDKFGAAFVTGGHIFGGIESTLRALQAHMSIFEMKLVDGERDYQSQFPFGVGAATGDPPFNSSTEPGHVDEIFLAAGKLLGNRVGRLVLQQMTQRAAA